MYVNGWEGVSEAQEFSDEFEGKPPTYMMIVVGNGITDDHPTTDVRMKRGTVLEVLKIRTNTKNLYNINPPKSKVNVVVLRPQRRVEFL